MAPEFFPFIACAVLAATCVILIVAAVFVETPRRLIQLVLPALLRFLRPLLLLAVIPALGMLVLLGHRGA